MKKILIFMSTALLVACGGDEKQSKSDEKQVAVTTIQPAIMSYIPADSPLLITSSFHPETYPKRYLEVMQSNMDGAVKYIEVIMKQAMNEVAELEAKKDAAFGNVEEETSTGDNDSAKSKKDQQKAKLLTFVDKWLVQDKLSKAGFKVGETQFAMYLVDLFPVIRIKLSEGHQIEAMLNEMQSEFEMPLTVTDVNGIKVREIGDKKLTILVATHDDFLVITGAPSAVKDQMISQLVGAEKPTKSLADDRSALDQVRKAHGFINDDLMVLDFHAIADHFIYPSKHNSTLVNYLQIDDNMLSAVCKEEISTMLGNAPRMVAGSKALTNDTIEGAFIWEMNQGISQDLAKMAGRVPHGNNEAAFAFGISFDMVNAKEVATKYVNEIVNSPYQCEHFTDLNQKAVDLQAQLSQPIPPFVGNFKGFNFSLDELKLDMANANLDNPNPKDIIKSFKTQVFLAVDETQALLGMAQMMMPQLQDMEINTDGSLITLADKVPMISGKDIPLDISELYAAISSDTIGFSMGHQGGGELSDKVKQEGTAALMTFSANADGYRQIMEQIFAMAEMPNMPEQVKKELAMQKELTLSMLYWKSQNMQMTFNDQGFETDFVIKY
ncbi:MAG: hypothetical protein R3E90_04705 [Marinicella sp.]